MKWIVGAILFMSLNSSAAVSADSAAQVAGPAAVVAAAAASVVKSPAASPSATLLKTKESEIPVHLDGDKKAAGNESPIFKVLMSLSVIGILGCGAFFLIRKYAKKGNTKSPATQIKVLTQHYLGPKKSLAIIRVAGESILVGVTDHNISLIKELSLLDEEIPETTPKKFTSVFSVGKDESMDFAEDEFSMSGIKDFVSSKLKNMRSLE